MKRCTYCGVENEDDSNFCMACGSRFEDTAPSQELAVQQETEEIQETTVAQETDKSQEPAVMQEIEKRQEPAMVHEVERLQEPVMAQEPEKSRCKACGAYIEANEKFCPQCGVEQGSSKIVEIKEVIIKKLPKDKKMIAPIVGGILLALIVLIIVPKLFKGSKYDTFGANALDLAHVGTDMFFYNNKKIVDEIENSDIRYTTFSIDRTKVAYIEDYDWDEGGTLYLFDEKGKKEIDDGVIFFAMSDSGNGIAYYKDYDYDDDTATLMLYNGSKSVEIEDDISIYIDEEFLIISPDGKTVAFVEYNDDDNLVGYISVNGKEPKKLGKNKICFAISDDGKYVYYLELDEDAYDGELYVRIGEKDIKLASDVDDIGDIYFNKDYSQILFTYDDKTYISVKGSEKNKVSSESTFPLLPDNAIWKSSSWMKTIGINSFADSLLLSDSKVYYLNRKFESNKIIDRCADVVVTNDMEKVVYIDYSGDLYMVTNLDKKRPNEVHLNRANDIESFSVSEDGDLIYYVNEDDELYSITKSNKPKKIADDVYSNNLVTLGSKLFFLVEYRGETGTLYYTTGSGKNKVSNADDVFYIERLGNGIYYQTYDSGEKTIYGSQNGSKFTKILEWDE